MINCVDKEYERLWIRAEYETMGWDREPEPELEFELDETSTTLREKKIANP